jgi:hypothetical protein
MQELVIFSGREKLPDVALGYRMSVSRGSTHLLVYHARRSASSEILPDFEQVSPKKVILLRKRNKI